jgi:hypothetical protein
MMRVWLKPAARRVDEGHGEDRQRRRTRHPFHPRHDGQRDGGDQVEVDAE